MTNTNHEKQMLRTAKKLRRLVYADFMMKTANPAIASLVSAVMPVLRSLGPKALGMLKNVPPEMWAQIIPSLITQLMPKAPATANAKTHVDSMTTILKKGGVSNPEETARVLFLAAVETGSAHRKEANPVVTEALQMVNKMQSELKTIKEFV